MPSWSPSEPQDERPQPTTSPTTPAGADDVAAARRLLAELFENAPTGDDDSSRESDQ